MRKPRQINVRTYFRAIVAVAMMVVWSLVTISGFLLWSVLHGPRAGAQILLLNLTKREWGELHVWSSVSQLVSPSCIWLLIGAPSAAA